METNEAGENTFRKQDHLNRGEIRKIVQKTNGSKWDELFEIAKNWTGINRKLINVCDVCNRVWDEYINVIHKKPQIFVCI